MNNNTKYKHKALNKEQRRALADAGRKRKSQHAKVARNKNQ
jgi:hypothetical protein